MASEIKLPSPSYKGSLTLEETIQKRRSIRELKTEPLTLAQVSQLLWAAQGITDSGGLRTAPSAGALYPLDIFLLADSIEGLAPGIYKYIPAKHAIERKSEGKILTRLTREALWQDWVSGAPAAIVITAVYQRVCKKYGERGVRYAHIEVGCVTQNIYLEATALNLGTTIIGAFDDDKVKAELHLAADQEPIAVLPIGKY